MALSTQLRQITSGLEQQAANKAGVGESSTILEAQQALTQGQGRPGATGAIPSGKLAAGITQQQGQRAIEAQQQLSQQEQAATGRAINVQGQRGARQLQEQQQMSSRDISERQRKGELRQNDASLRQAKRLQAEELASQKRMQQTGIAFDNRVSFLTRKQRADLSELGRLVKQQVFDSRLQFKADERGRSFSNARQLADYAVASARDRQELAERLQDMQQSYEKEQIMFDAVNKKLVQAIEAEYKKSEQERDQEMLRTLAEMKRAAEREQRRRAAKAQAINSIIVGGATIAGAVYGGGPAGAAAGAGIGQAVAGGAQSSGMY